MERDGEEIEMEKITVAHVAGGLTTGGVESVIYQYVSHMPSDRYNWIYVSYDTPDQTVQKRFEQKGFRVYSVTKKKENFFKSCWEVFHIFKENKVQIVHSHMTLMCFVTNILGLAAGAKVRISHSHLVLSPDMGKRILYWFFKKLTTWTATTLFACSTAAGEYLYGKRNMSAGQVIIMNNALDCEAFCFDYDTRERLRETYGLKGKTVLGNVGRFTEQKNQEFLIQTFKKYQETDPESRLILVGDGPLMDAMKQLTINLEIENKVLFVGSTSKANEWYMAMDVFVFPSLYEGLGIAALEAQAAGLPVLMSSEVPKEAVLTDQVISYPLEAGAEEWARQIQICREKGRGADIYHILKEKHLDIKTEALRLDHFYRKGIWE